MPDENRSWHSYISEADKTEDTAALRKIVGACARELYEAEQRIATLEREARSADRTASRAAAEIRAAAAARATIAAAAMRQLKKLMPAAIRQANKGKPALLRMILRATK